MMTGISDLLQNFWDDILSGEPDRIRSAFAPLDKDTQSALLDHLQRMVHEDGWQPQQREAAFTALQVIHSSMP